MRFQEIFRTAVASGTAASAASGFIPTNYMTRTIQATIGAAGVAGSGLTAATVVIYGSNDAFGKVVLDTFTLTSGTPSDAVVITAPVNYRYLAVAVSALTGTGELVVTATAAESFKE